MEEAHFLENIYKGQILFVHFHGLSFTLDTVCADNKDKPVSGCKNQLIKKCLRNISLLTFITMKSRYTFRKFTIVNILGYIFYKEIQITTAAYKVSVKFLQNINGKPLRVEYLTKLSQYFGNPAKAVMRSHNKTFFILHDSRFMALFIIVRSCP